MLCIDGREGGTGAEETHEDEEAGVGEVEHKGGLDDKDGAKSALLVCRSAVLELAKFRGFLARPYPLSVSPSLEIVEAASLPPLD